jgi:hypothetical protein
VSTAASGFDQFLKGTEFEAGKYVNPRTFASFVTTAGGFACLGGRGAQDPNNPTSGACAPPGLTITHRTSKGFRFEAGYTPRYIPQPPTLAGQSAPAVGQFGAFIIREWRF